VKIDDAVDSIAKFFNDLIGAWVPGTVFAGGLAVMHLGPGGLVMVFQYDGGVGSALTMAGFLFALGHLLLAVTDFAIKPALARIKVLKKFNVDEASKRRTYQWFLEIVKTSQSGGNHDWGFQDLRSFALSVSTEAASLGRRFMFISLLCNGVGTALMLLLINFVSCSLFMPELLHSYEHTAPPWLQVVLLLGSAILLFKQGEAFYSRAMTTPFAVAVAQLTLKKGENDTSS